MFKFVASVLVLLASVLAVPAAAQNTPNTFYSYRNDVYSTKIPVRASIGGRCFFASGNAPNENYTIPGFIDETAWTRTVQFKIDCNTASRVAVVSTNGGLKTAGTITDSGYVGLAPYSVSLDLTGDSATATDTCTAAALAVTAAPTCGMRGPATAATGLRLTGPSLTQTTSTITLSAPAYAGSSTLVSGAYTDTLTITIAASP